MNRQQRRAAERDAAKARPAADGLADWATAATNLGLNQIAFEMSEAMKAVVDDPEVGLSPEQVEAADRVGTLYLERWLHRHGQTLPSGWQYLDADQPTGADS